MTAIFDSLLIPTLDSLYSSFLVLLNPGNMGIAVGTSLLSCIHAEIYAFHVERPSSWIFRFLPLWLYRVVSCPIEMPDPENTGVAVGITLLSGQGAEIRMGPWGSPSAVYVHFLGQLGKG